MPYDEITPASVMTGFWRWAGIGILALVLLSALIVGGWQAGWWVTNQDANRAAHLIRDGSTNQKPRREQITTQIANVHGLVVSIARASGDPQEITALQSQRIAVVNIAR